MNSIVSNLLALISSDQLLTLEERLGYHFTKKELLIQACIHSSFCNEYPQAERSNERYEFLGDSILGLIIADFLFQYFPDKDEGFLSQKIAALVSTESCALMMKQLHILPLMLVGKGEKQNLEQAKLSLAADFFEALLGAIYLDGGYDTAAKWLLHLYKDFLIEQAQASPHNYKALLQEYLAHNRLLYAQYAVQHIDGEGHSPRFMVSVTYADKTATGEGHSKREAEQQAARQALIQLQVMS